MIGIAGVGFVGSALFKSFTMKNLDVVCYDKYKSEFNDFNILIDTDIVFLTLPTCFSNELQSYDMTAINDVCYLLEQNKYKGIVVIKSTVEPGTTDNLCETYKELKFIHNPEFLSASTAFEDFHNQTHVVIGISKNMCNNEQQKIIELYNNYYPSAELSICKALESESMKMFVNCFYAVKIQFFNELYLTCQASGCDFNNVRNMMIKNKWINPMHTLVPGTDNKLSYGGCCFPKDTNALLHYMREMNVPNKVLQGTIEERNMMRNDNINIID